MKQKRRNKNKPHQFDGKYYKIKVDELDKHLIIIQGVNYKDRECFVQYAFEGDFKSKYHSFSISKLETKDDVVYLENNIFAKNLMHIELPELHLTANFQNLDLTKDSEKVSTMGVLKNIPFVQCKHEIISLSRKCDLSINNFNDINLNSKGEIYIERNWGKSFPKEYLWIHCYDQIDGESFEFQFAVAKPKFLGLRPKVHLGILNFKNKTYNFGLQRKTKVRLIDYNSLNNTLSFVIDGKDFQIVCSLNQGFFTEFLSPGKNGMSGKILESLNSNLTLNFANGINKFQLTSKNVSSELVNIQGLL